ncbi:MAG TPA: hypothetical protein VIJ17_02435, partial [Pseudolabrys sp.]
MARSSIIGGGLIALISTALRASSDRSAEPVRCGFRRWCAARETVLFDPHPTPPAPQSKSR